jgi:hypothetical protein
MREELRTTAIRVERALANVPASTVIRQDKGKPLIAQAGNRANVTVEGVITAGDLYELASAILYLNIKREDRGNEL